ncbi:hypothetical protein C0J52_00502 [Blattella germanica]|nr:hypothetical protein C0J52_00502 [Blattella germanica]
MAIAGVFLSWAWKEFSRSPIEVNVETTNYPLYKLPFPAITICPATNVKKTVGENLLTRYLNFSINDNIQNITWNIMSGLSKCQYPFYFRMQAHFEQVTNLFQHFTDFNITHFMIEVLPSCEEIFDHCFWLGQEVNCCDVFDLQRTEAGFCYSFNSLTSEKTRHCTALDEFSETSQSHARPKGVTNVPSRCQPRHNIASGTTTGLEVFLTFSNPEDSLGLGQRDKNGFRVFFHHPSQFPESGKGVYVPEESAKVMQVKVATSVTQSGPDVRALSISKRRCLFPDETHLSVFHTYSQENCLLECRLKNMAEMCGCHPYFFSGLSVELRIFRPPHGARGFEEVDAIDCGKCLPTCHNTLYSLDYSFTADGNPYASNQAAYLDVYYRDLGAIKYQQRLSFDFMDLVGK